MMVVHVVVLVLTVRLHTPPMKNWQGKKLVCTRASMRTSAPSSLSVSVSTSVISCSRFTTATDMSKAIQFLWMHQGATVRSKSWRDCAAVCKSLVLSGICYKILCRIVLTATRQTVKTFKELFITDLCFHGQAVVVEIVRRLNLPRCCTNLAL